MSRAGYSDDLDPWALIQWRGQVASATRGKRGQRLLTDMLKALDSMPEKSLTTHELEDVETGKVCALGALGKYRGIDMQKVDPGEPEEVAALFNIASQLAREIVHENDEGGWQETPGQRWKRMRKWVASNIRSTETPIVTEVKNG